MNTTPAIPKTAEPRTPGRSRTTRRRLAVVLSHPVQYYAPWFRQVRESDAVELRVFYLWNPEAGGAVDRGFGVPVKWDIPLLEGYESEFVPNLSADPGTHHFRGLVNPELAARIAAWNPEAVLFFGYAWQAHLGAIFSPALRDIPFLFRGDSHDLFPAAGPRSLLSRFVRRLAFRRFDAFLSVGRAHRAYLEGAGVPARKIFFAPHCIDNARFAGEHGEALRRATSWKEELGITENRPVALFVGKLEEKKRPQDLLEAFLARHPEHDPDGPALLFVGNGKLEGGLRERAGDRIGRSVFFAPFQNQTEMPKVYATGDLLVLPSFGRGETWGLVVNEAMNLGTAALVSSHVGCAADLVIDGETGWTFEAGNTGDLQLRLADALSDPHRLGTMGEAARDHIGNYSYEAATDGLLSAMRSLAGS